LWGEPVYTKDFPLVSQLDATERGYSMRTRSLLSLCILVISLNSCSPRTNDSPTSQPSSELAGFDCSSLQSLAPDSAGAHIIVSDFIADFREAYPTEYMRFYRLYAVDTFEGYVRLQGMVTEEETNAILI
jgi:hypothetical protein